MIDFKKISAEIVSLLKNQKLYMVSVFGSHAYGKAHDESDLDLLVVLDKEGVSGNYKEVLGNKKAVSVHLRELRKKVPVDLLVYTRDEWTMLKNSGSSFIRRIEKEGVRLI
jgi:uncharacterized protein